ncbi:MAG: hypothetical protein LBT27_08000 [Prevotellaceae bacterium]|jgi:hypothetical protein|nr:hypothetical protein [Prevotellaceae bacterium]
MIKIYIYIIFLSFTAYNSYSQETGVHNKKNNISPLMLQTYKIYNIGDKMTYSYEFIPNGNDFNNSGITLADVNEIDNVVFEVVKFTIKGDDDTIWFRYKYPPLPQTATSSFIENDDEVWIHPPRSYFFKILELNPFPYIKKPYITGSKWTWDLDYIGSSWGDVRWKTWEKKIINHVNYEITGDTVMQTAIGKLKCFITKATATNELGTTYLTSYFNEKYGFVELDYINIDNSKITLKIKEYNKAMPETERWQMKNY